MTRVYLKGICVVKTPVFCCLKKAFLDPLKAEEKDQLECKPFQNIEKEHLGIVLKATLLIKMPFYLPSPPTLTNIAHEY